MDPVRHIWGDTEGLHLGQDSTALEFIQAKRESKGIKQHHTYPFTTHKCGK